jgi:RNA polymerase sigma factor (sigma-70 family)
MADGANGSLLGQLRQVAFPRDGGAFTDGALLALYIARRDEAAFAALVRRHGPMVLGVCRRILGNAADIDDVFQATFVVMARKAAVVRPADAVASWLYGVAYRTALEARRAARRRRKHETQAAISPDSALHVDACDQELRHELRLVLDQELNRLPDRLRLPVILCDVEGRTRREVADQLKLPGGTLSNRLTAARAKLAKRLTRRGFGPSAAALAAGLGSPALAVEVPAALLVSTIQAAASVAAGHPTVGSLISSEVAALVQGALHTMFWTRFRKIVAVLLVLGVLGGGAAAFLRPAQVARNGADPADPAEVRAQAASGDSDLTRLGGTWTVIALEEKGMAQPEGRFKDVKMRLVITGNTVSIKTTTPDGRDVGGTKLMMFVLDEKASPKQIDVSYDGQTILGIYAFEKGTLKLNMDLTGKARPNDFKTDERGDQRSYVLEKEKTKRSEGKGAAPAGVEDRAPKQDRSDKKKTTHDVVDAETLLAEALQKAKAAKKRVLLVACTKSCLPCRQLYELFDELKPILDKHLVLAKLDLVEMKNADRVHRRYRKDIDERGNYVPWMVILDDSAAALAVMGQLVKPDSVVGLPHGSDANRRYFLDMLRVSCPAISERELEQIDAAAKNLRDRIWAPFKK